MFVIRTLSMTYGNHCFILNIEDTESFICKFLKYLFISRKGKIAAYGQERQRQGGMEGQKKGER